jgi:hypothetical protein
VLAGLPKLAGDRQGMNVERRLVSQTATSTTSRSSANARPGRGILGIAGDPTQVQVPLVTVSTPDRRVPQGAVGAHR